MSNVAKSKEQPDFLIDRTKGSLVNTNVNKKIAYKKQRSILRSAQNSASRINDLENALSLLLEKKRNDQ